MIKKMKYIKIAVTNDLLTDQRVDRSCKALVEAGYVVTLIGRRLPESSQLVERCYTTRRMRLVFRRSALFYAEYNLRLFLRLLISKADAFYSNDTDTLLACTMAAKLRRKKLFFDAHELFPDVPELVGKPIVQKVWCWVEKICLPRVDAAISVCSSVAEEYGRRYGVKMMVVRNLPDGNVARQDLRPQMQGGKYMLLYQGAVNVGRGVKEAIDVLQWLPNCRLVIAGDGDLREGLQHYASTLEWSDRVTFLGRVEPDKLHQLTIQADLGLCMLEDLGLNYRFALPNRIADFAAAGVPLIATDFCEIRHVIDEYQIGELVPSCPHEKEGVEYQQYVLNLSQVISSALDKWSEMDIAERSRRFDRARHDLNWNTEKKKFQEKIRTILI